jgi:hypothetical protein
MHFDFRKRFRFLQRSTVVNLKITQIIRDRVLFGDLQTGRVGWHRAFGAAHRGEPAAHRWVAI